MVLLSHLGGWETKQKSNNNAQLLLRSFKGENAGFVSFHSKTSVDCVRAEPEGGVLPQEEEIHTVLELGSVISGSLYQI